MNIIGAYNTFSNHIYDSKVDEVLGKVAHTALHFSESYGLKIVESFEWAKHGEKDYKAKQFREELSHEENQDDPDFYIDTSSEKRVVQLLESHGVINDQDGLKEKAALICDIAFNMLTVAVTLPVTIPSAALSLGLRCYLQNRMHPLTCLTPLRKKIWSESDPISLFTCNVALTEFQIMNYFNVLPDTKIRAPEMADYLTRVDSDFICLQEAFDIDEVRSTIMRKLKHHGYYVAATSKREQVFGMTGGILLASRYRILDIGFHEYKVRGGVDKRVRKGVIAAIIELKEGVNICVATTHMQAGFTTSLIEQDQFIEAKNFLKEMMEGNHVYDVIFLGDFNDGRFERDQINSAKTKENYQSAFVDCLLKGTHQLPGFKDLTVPDMSYPFSTSVSHQSDFDVHSSKNQETGVGKGSVYDTTATSYQYLKEIVCLRVGSVYAMNPQELMSAIEQRLQDQPIDNQALSGLIDGELAIAKKQTYRKPSVCDHVAKMNKKNNLFSETNYRYEVLQATGEVGFLSDHSAVKVTLYPEGSTADV